MTVSVADFKFGTKAKTLERLTGHVRLASIPSFCFFTVSEWDERRDKICEQIQSRFTGEKVIIRSSAAAEDAATQTLAGQHDSVLGVLASQKEKVIAAVEQVIQSYSKNKFRDPNLDSILVQEFIHEDILMSGVLFTQDLDTGAPYYVINYDEESGRTDTVTSGGDFNNRTLLVHRNSIAQLSSKRFRKLLVVVDEIEKITGCDHLDIEFAIDSNLKVYLFQVRPLTTKSKWPEAIRESVDEAVESLQSFVRDYFLPSKGIYGKTTLLANMSDWNPAEMIGTAPRPLAYSLYDYLITSGPWSLARKQMGYFYPKNKQLMVSLRGCPYIDVRLSFNSFLPEDLSPNISEKIVDAWLNRLSENKELHDKVEFEVAITAFSFDFEKRLEEILGNVLNEKEKEEFCKKLFSLTKKLVTGERASIQEELDKIESLEATLRVIQGNPSPYPLEDIQVLLDSCIQNGIISFSILARHGFIAKSFLDSLVSERIFTQEDLNRFTGSIETIASQFLEDVDLFSDGVMTEDIFMKKYGHLRPGTYDIMSFRYDQRTSLSEGMSGPLKSLAKEKEFQLTKDQKIKLEKTLKKTGLGIDLEGFFQYLRDAISSREYGKFLFTKVVSEAIEKIAKWGERYGLSREDLSYLKIQDILSLGSKKDDLEIHRNLQHWLENGRKQHLLTSSLHLPYLLDRIEDIAIVPLLKSSPNFITKNIVQGSYFYLDGKVSDPKGLEGKIVLIESADPGFDWIFTCAIKGLITKYGGANSHMAIRCAEFGLPAAIGCGEQNFDRILRSHEIELNCLENRIVSLGSE